MNGHISLYFGLLSIAINNACRICRKSDHHLNQDVLGSHQNYSLLTCGLSCLNDDLCLSFNYMVDQGICELVSASPGNETFVSGYDFYSPLNCISKDTICYSNAFDE